MIVPCSSLESCLNAMVMGIYHVLVIGITVPLVDRERIADVSRKIRQEARMVSIERLDSPNLEAADYCIKAGDEDQLTAIIAKLSRS